MSSGFNAQFVYTRQARSPIVFEPDVLGAKNEIIVAGYNGTIGLPQLGGPSWNERFDMIVAPSTFDLGVLPLIHRDSDRVDWGRQFTQPRGLVAVSAFQFDFVLSTDEETARLQMGHIEDGIEMWMGTVRDWIEVRTWQLVGVESGDVRPDSSGFYWSWKGDQHWHGSSSNGKIVKVMIGSTIPVSAGFWDCAVASANESKRPPDSYLLLRDAKAKWGDGQNQLSVILSGMVAEIVVKREIASVLGKLQVPLAFIDDLTRAPMGKLTSIAKRLGIELPSTLHAEVFEARNKAIHHNAHVSDQEAYRAHKMAKSVVSSFDPLPHAGPEPKPHIPWSESSSETEKAE